MIADFQDGEPMMKISNILKLNEKFFNLFRSL